MRRPPSPPPFPYTTLFRSLRQIRIAPSQPAAASDFPSGENARASTSPECLSGSRSRQPPAASHNLMTPGRFQSPSPEARRSEEHTSELQSLRHLVCRLLLE